MTREEYIVKQSKELLRLVRQRKKLNARVTLHDQMSSKAFDKLNTDIHWLCMNIDKTRERIGYVLGYLTLLELRDEYQPSGWTKYKGIKGEMLTLNFSE